MQPQFKFLLVFCISLSWAALCIIPSTNAADCTLKEVGTKRVIEIIDGDTIVLSSGQRVRLVGIQAPKLPLDRKGFKIQPLAQEAKKKLAQLILGQDVTLKYGTTPNDRHKRLLAHIFIGDLWVQKEMIASGLARTYSFSDNRMCVAHLLTAEKKARQARIGIWSLPFYEVRQALDIEKLSILHNSYQIVRGQITTVSDGQGGRTYINFGKDWKTDFTITVFNSNRRYFKNAPYSLSDLKGAVIRVRGWLGFHNGPSMNVTHPEQIEVLK